MKALSLKYSNPGMCNIFALLGELLCEFIPNTAKEEPMPLLKKARQIQTWPTVHAISIDTQRYDILHILDNVKNPTVNW